MTADESVSLAFPVLGVPPGSWPGYRRLAMHGAARHRDDTGMIGDSQVVSLMHSYYLPEQPYPSVVLGQAPAYPHRELSSGAPWPALMRLLRRRPAAPEIDAPHSTSHFAVRIQGLEFDAIRMRWRDDRIGHIRFDWQESRRVEIASWLHPLDEEFFGRLSEITAPLVDRA